MKYLASIVKSVLLISTSTGHIFISPLLSVIGVFSLLRIFVLRKVFRFEFYLLLFFVYVVISTLAYDPGAFSEFEYYRYDGNIWISLTPIFMGLLSRQYFSETSLARVIYFCTFIYLVSFLLWMVTKDCSFSGVCSFPGLFISRNATGGFLSVIATIAFIFWMRGVRYFSLIFFLLCFFLVATFSRGSFLGLIASAVIYVIFVRRKTLVDLHGVFFLIIFTFGIAIYLHSPTFDYSSDTGVIGEFVDERLETKSHNVAARAFFFWPKAIDLFLRSPIFGVGFSGFNDYYSHPYTGFSYSSGHAHNTFLHVVAEMGILGLGLLILLICSFRSLWLSNRASDPVFSDAVYFSFLSVVFASFTEHRLFTPASMIIVSSLIGLYLTNLRIIRFGGATSVRVTAPGRQ